MTNENERLDGFYKIHDGLCDKIEDLIDANDVEEKDVFHAVMYLTAQLSRKGQIPREVFLGMMAFEYDTVKLFPRKNPK